MKSFPTKEDFLLWHSKIEGLESAKLIKPKENSFSADEIKRLAMEPFDYIFYVKEYKNIKNELKSGLITFLKVLEHLTNLHGKFTEDIKRGISKLNCIADTESTNRPIAINKSKLEDILTEILNTYFCDSDAHRFTVTFENHQLEYSCIGNKYDFYNLTILISKDYINNDKIINATWELEIMSNHTSFRVKSIEFGKKCDFYMNELANIEKFSTNYNNNLSKMLLRRFKMPEELSSRKVNEISPATLNESIYNILYSGRLDDMVNLKMISETFSKMKKSSQSYIELKNILINIFKSIPLYDRGIYEPFQKFFIENFDSFRTEIFDKICTEKNSKSNFSEFINLYFPKFINVDNFELINSGVKKRICSNYKNDEEKQTIELFAILLTNLINCVNIKESIPNSLKAIARLGSLDYVQMITPISNMAFLIENYYKIAKNNRTLIKDCDKYLPRYCKIFEADLRSYVHENLFEADGAILTRIFYRTLLLEFKGNQENREVYRIFKLILCFEAFSIFMKNKSDGLTDEEISNIFESLMIYSENLFDELLEKTYLSSTNGFKRFFSLVLAKPNAEKYLTNLPNSTFRCLETEFKLLFTKTYSLSDFKDRIEELFGSDLRKIAHTNEMIVKKLMKINFEIFYELGFSFWKSESGAKKSLIYFFYLFQSYPNIFGGSTAASQFETVIDAFLDNHELTHYEGDKKVLIPSSKCQTKKLIQLKP